jgi:hypothetical protein
LTCAVKPTIKSSDDFNLVPLKALFLTGASVKPRSLQEEKSLRSQNNNNRHKKVATFAKHGISPNATNPP